ncbi:MULE transposase domain [Sesbania bispinosa]|nr:MULE transposase domain [Sesbania bispinosa]
MGLEDLCFYDEDAYENEEQCGGPLLVDEGSVPFFQTNDKDNGGYFVDEGGYRVYFEDGEFDDNSNEEDCNAENDQVVKFRIDTLQDLIKIDLVKFSPHEITKYDFRSLEVANLFYEWYAGMNGFECRKGKVITSRKSGRILQQNFLCNRQGEREDNGVLIDQRKREPKPLTRCNCKAEFRAHVDINSGCWKMSAADVHQMNNMLKVGVGPPQIFGSFANQCGGYEKIGFWKKDIYNQIVQQRRLQHNDATSAVKFLRDLGLNDPVMFTRHTCIEDGRLEHLFWCDGIMQMNYRVFGDVLALDATYGKNKYRLPLVVFSGVNHHNRTTIFAGAMETMQ